MSDFQGFAIVPGMKDARIPVTEAEKLADRLKRTREAFGLNQADWSRLVGIEPQAWSNYEQGIRRISIDQALKVCAATGVTTDWIYRGLMTSGLPTEVQLNLQRKRR
ncbi:MAG TPA: helix-turn-helix transcriptional regulator [Pseudolabrys sp.]|nr:helix-turn-helix transcriptional regulator [Pseudolabrys sp.]